MPARLHGDDGELAASRLEFLGFLVGPRPVGRIPASPFTGTAGSNCTDGFYRLEPPGNVAGADAGKPPSMAGEGGGGCSLSLSLALALDPAGSGSGGEGSMLTSSTASSGTVISLDLSLSTLDS
jgi:hypothetical protein